MKLEMNSNVDGRRLENIAICEHFGSRGFTLIEALIAIFLLVTAIFAIISTTNMIIKGNVMAKMMTTATTLAKDKMEFLKNQSYENYTGLSGGTDYATSDSTVQSTSTNAFFTRTWVIDSTSLGTNNMKIITVTASWSWMGNNSNVSLKTIVGK